MVRRYGTYTPHLVIVLRYRIDVLKRVGSERRRGDPISLPVIKEGVFGSGLVVVYLPD